MERTRILFAGTPTFAVPALSALIAADWPVVGVYTQPDRPSGRGRRTVDGPVKQVARDAGVPVLQPPSLKDPAAQQELQALRPDLMVVAAYGLILPAAILASPRLGCINIHASLLPRWRGAAPIQRAILAGDEVTGISLMQMEQGLDTGPVHATHRTRIGPRETGGSLHDRLAAIGAKLLLDRLPDILTGQITPEPQDAAAATYASKLTKDEAAIDWQRSAIAIDRQVRAFDPWPVAQARCGDQTLRIWEASPLDDAPTGGAAPGTILGTGPHGIDVATGAGVLRITRLQAPGKRPIAASDFAHARRIDGIVLG
jgi:methionyl-tRNA formyltransferase